jgi:steroid 5-alpha reductase family enzyme
MQQNKVVRMLIGALSAAALLCIVMAAAWIVQRRLNNAGWVDVFWSFGTGFAAAGAAVVPLPGGPAGMPSLRALVIGGLALIWGCRLGIYLAHRTATGHREDVRYARFRMEWGGDFQPRLFSFLMIQALVAALLAICVMLAARNPVSGMRVADLAGLLVLAVAVIGEGTADRQMGQFRANPDNRGRVCDTGLWALSRHPNYFFECLTWCAYPFFAIGPHFPWGYASLLGPAAMIWLLTCVSGIPPLEREMLADRGEAYRHYQARVSAFLPLPPKRMET